MLASAKILSAISRVRSALTALVERNCWLRSVAVGALAFGGVYVFLATVWDIYPPSDWLFTKLVQIWFWVLLLHLSCLTLGHVLISRVIKPGGLPVLERLLFDMVVGLIGFALLMYLGGALSVYSSAWSLALPIMMLALGLPTLVKEWRQSGPPDLAPGRYSPLMKLAAALGVVCLFVLYLQALTPNALNYDSKWYHLTVGEDYAREGGIVPFPSDYNKSAFPQLTGLIYAWGCLVPGLDTPMRVMFILHNEFAVVLWILLGVSAGTNFLVGERHVNGAWTAFFLFPGIFVYDSNLGGSADHVLGLFALPVFLAAMRAIEKFDVRRCVLLGVVTGGAVLAKYQAVYLIVGVTPAVLIRFFWLLFRERKQLGPKLWIGPLSIVAGCVLISLPHFLKNVIFYGNPVYPYLTDFFTTSHPVQPETAVTVGNMWMDHTLKPKGTPSDQAWATVRLLFTFSFEPHYSQDRPVFGSLFTLLMPTVALVREKRRLLFGILVSLSALAFWASTYLVDRYIQTFSAILVAVTAGLIVRAWETGIFARIGVFVLVATQIIWSGDALFYSGHALISDSIGLIRSGYEGRAQTRFDSYLHNTRKLDERLPPDAVLLFHNTRLALGVNRKVHQDLVGYQSLISYRNVRNARDLVLLYRSLGITHVVYERGKWPALTRQEEVVFSVFVERYVKETFRQGPYEVITLPQRLPPEEDTYRVMSLSLPGYLDGIYSVDAMHTIDHLVHESKRYEAPDTPVSRLAEIVSHLDEVDAVLVHPGRQIEPKTRKKLRANFKKVFDFKGSLLVYVRRLDERAKTR